MDKLTIGGREFSSRLFVGTGKFSSNDAMLDAILESGSEMITVAMKRLDTSDAASDDMLKHINREHVQFLPNTSGVRNADEAVLAAQLSRDCFGTNFIKLEIHPDPKYLLPDPVETLKATEKLAKLGFVVLHYIQADPVLCKRLEDVGTAAVMPLGAPIGTNKGLTTREMLRIIIDQTNVPVVVDAGLVARCRGDGDGCRRGARQHGYRGGWRPGGYGARFPPRHGGWTHCLPCRTRKPVGPRRGKQPSDCISR